MYIIYYSIYNVFISKKKIRKKQKTNALCRFLPQSSAILFELEINTQNRSTGKNKLHYN